MPSRRAEIAMTDDEVRAVLAEGREVTLVTFGPDGLPDPVPMWYVTDDAGTVLMRTYTRSQKVRNVARDPRCAALVTDGGRYAELRGVQITGRLEPFHDEDAILDILVAFMTKYEGVPAADAAAAREAARPSVAKMTGLRLVADRVASWDHRKMFA